MSIEMELRKRLGKALATIDQLKEENLRLKGLQGGDIKPYCTTRHFACDCQIALIAKLQADNKGLIEGLEKIEETFCGQGAGNFAMMLMQKYGGDDK